MDEIGLSQRNDFEEEALSGDSQDAPRLLYRGHCKARSAYNLSKLVFLAFLVSLQE